MENFRPDKKLKRKRGWGKWRKARNILENWWKEEGNRVKAGLPRRNPPVELSQKRKYPIRGITPAKRRELMGKSLKEAEKRATKQKAASRFQKIVLKLKQYQKLWNWILRLIKK